MNRGGITGVKDVLETDEVRQILTETFFSSIPAPPRLPGETSVLAEPVEALPAPEAIKGRGSRRGGSAGANAKARPEHYKVICISMYNEDLERLDNVVRELKRRGFTKANRSAVLRAAMEQLEIDRVRKGL